MDLAVTDSYLHSSSVRSIARSSSGGRDGAESPSPPGHPNPVFSFDSGAAISLGLFCVEERDPSDACAWCQGAFPDWDFRSIYRGADTPHSGRAGGFDVRLVTGRSATLIANWLTTSGENMHWRPSIAILPNSTVEERVYLLRCGFDDVFDPFVMPTPEGRARLIAIWNGFKRFGEQLMRNQELEKSLARMSRNGSWTKQQRKFLTALIVANNGFARYDELGFVIAGGGPPIRRPSLKVMACHIRAKLVSGYFLEAVTNRGYRLRQT